MVKISDNGGGMKWYILIMVLSILFPVFSYAFTSIGSTDFEEYDISLNPDSLIEVGLVLVDGVSETILWDEGFVYFELLNKTIRAQWGADLRFPDTSDGVVIQKRSFISEITNSWIAPYTYTLRASQLNYQTQIADNISIVNNYQAAYNWSRWICEDGYQVFFTPFNMSRSFTDEVMTYGEMNMTIGRAFNENQGGGFSFGEFITFYLGLISGGDTFGLPWYFSWLMRLISAISVLTAIMLIKDLTRL